LRTSPRLYSKKVAMPTPDPSIMMLHTVTGNQLKVLIALKILGICAPVLRVAVVANLERHTVSQALANLEILGYAEQHGRYTWKLSTACGQLPLWTSGMVEKLPSDGRKTTIPAEEEDINYRDIVKSSSSSATAPDGRKTTIPSAPHAAELADYLTAQTSCRRTRALTAVSAALAHDATPEHIRQEIDAWHAAKAELEKRGIRNFGYFVAKKLEDGENCDVKPPHKRDYSRDTTAYYIPEGYEDLIEH